MKQPTYTHLEFFNSTHEKWDRVNVKDVISGAVIPEGFYPNARWRSGVLLTIRLAHVDKPACVAFMEAMFRPVWDGRSHVNVFLCGTQHGHDLRISLNVKGGNGWDKKEMVSSVHAYFSLDQFFP